MTAANAAPQPKYLKDYQKPDFRAEGVHLTFKIGDLTNITSKVKYVRANKDANDIVLKGEYFTLKSVAMDGVVLSPERYRAGEGQLVVSGVPDAFTLEIDTELEPEKNTALEGLYRSSGTFCTQCEPHGFSRITYYLDRPDVMTTFTTRIEADKASCPVLLSNGNCVEKGDLGGGKHFAVWHDPFPKPCYLFALVAGDLRNLHDTFTTMSGKTVDLYIHVNPGNEGKCRHAMESLKNAMKWDEEKYGREYDLNVFHIVAVNDFNFGAMENKSLNIFNSSCILANPLTATDGDYLGIEGIVAHEYFHNWTGDRITCRDWFQLSLKEGLTVFRDQSFSGDMNSVAVQRIDDVETLRNGQFPEDAGPMAHPIRPDSYIEINNFYTATVYEKGAEVIRMMHTLMGPEKYRRATDLYFARHDGQAVTCDDFVQCMQDASGLDLSQFRLWYAQAGTPEITAKGVYDAAKKTYALTLSQSIPDTPGQTGKKPMHMPVAVGLVGARGDLLPEGTRVLELKEKSQTFVFDNIAEKPVPSILRGFSAPVKLTSDLTDDDLLFLMARDTDGFNRWDAGQTYLQRLILALASAPSPAMSGRGRGERAEMAEVVTGPLPPDLRSGPSLSRPAAGEGIPPALFDSFGALLADKKADKALVAKALSMPSETYLAQLMETVDVDGLYAARKCVMAEIGKKHLGAFRKIYEENADNGPYAVTPEAVGKRRLKAAALRYIAAADPTEGAERAAGQYTSAQNMTDKVVALGVLADTQTPEAEAAFADFYAAWKSDPLVLDKWFRLQAFADRPDAPECVLRLTAHPDFTFKNPNRLRSLIGAFAGGNLKWFHRADGAGYRLLADTVIKVNGINPQTAAGLLSPLRPWRRYDAARRGLMEAELRRILAQKDISNQVYEIASKSLG